VAALYGERHGSETPAENQCAGAINDSGENESEGIGVAKIALLAQSSMHVSVANMSKSMKAKTRK